MNQSPETRTSIDLVSELYQASWYNTTGEPLYDTELAEQLLQVAIVNAQAMHDLVQEPMPKPGEIERRVANALISVYQGTV